MKLPGNGVMLLGFSIDGVSNKDIDVIESQQYQMRRHCEFQMCKNLC